MKTIIIYDHMQNGSAVYSYIKKEFPQLKVRFVEFNHSKGIINKLKKIKQIGVINIVRGLIKNDNIIISTSPSTFQSMISDNIICINHGWATKMTPGINELQDKNKMNEYRVYKQKCKYIVCISDFDSTYYLKNESLSDINEPQFLSLGMPRNDYLIDNKNNYKIIKSIRNQLGISEKHKVFLYAPTHRETEEKNIKLNKRIIEEFKALDEILETKQYKILYRPHYLSTDTEEEIKKLKNIYYVGNDRYSDMRDLMILSDILITDYSSIFIDYLLIQKPIIFYSYDLDEYCKIRGLVIDYTNEIHTPGPKINNLKEILDIDENILNRYDLNLSRSFFHKNIDSKSTERVCKFIINQINK